jgi:hypothetical protein
LFPDSNIPSHTIQAYLETHYRVFGDTPTTLKVDEANPVLAVLHEANAVQSSAFITACNPFSQTSDDASNAARQQTLRSELKARELTFIEGIGQHPSNNWPGEASFLVLGLSLDAAKALGAQHGQNAIIWADTDATPRLVLLR